MIKYIEIPITSEDNLVIQVDAIVTCMRTAATTTDVMLKGGVGQTANLNLQLTHAADTAAASVANSIMEACKTISRMQKAPDVSYVMTPAQAVSAAAIA